MLSVTLLIEGAGGYEKEETRDASAEPFSHRGVS
jgi:hypothetical protein